MKNTGKLRHIMTLDIPMRSPYVSRMTINDRRQALRLTYAALAARSGLSLRTAHRLAQRNALPGSLCAQRQLAKALKLRLPELVAIAKGTP